MNPTINHGAVSCSFGYSRTRRPRRLRARGERPPTRGRATRMAIWVGTSGYNYPEWRGTFYPEKLPASKMLAYYVERFTTVEINATFYGMPSAKTVEVWGAAAPAGFTYVLKAP